MATPAAAATPATPARFQYDLAFQKRMLRVLYQDAEFTCTTGTHLTPDHFETPSMRWLADKIVGYAKKHGSGIGCDALRIELDRDTKVGRVRSKEVRAKIESLVGALDRPVKDKSFIREELFRFIKNQTTRQAILNSLDHLDTHDFDAIDTEFQRVLEVRESLGGGLGHFFVRDVKTRTRRRRAYEKNGIATGLRVDDYLKPGGVPPKSLAVIVAPSGKGKSHCMVHIGKSAVLESGAKVLHITTELSEEAILDRYDAAFSSIAINKLETERRTVQKRVRGLGRKLGEFLIVKEFPPATLTASGIRAFIRQLERVAFYPTVIIVDSADDMVPDAPTRRRESNMYEDMGSVYRELRRLSYEVNAPVWTVSQTNKTALNKEFVDWDQIADSAKKVMVADLVMILLQTLEEKKNKLARFFVAKNRLGVDKFDIRVRLDWSRSTIRNV